MMSTRAARSQRGAERRARHAARDARILQMLADGHTLEEIAVACFYAVSTVKGAIGDLMAEAGARTRTQLVAQAVADGKVNIRGGEDCRFAPLSRVQIRWDNTGVPTCLHPESAGCGEEGHATVTTWIRRTDLRPPVT